MSVPLVCAYATPNYREELNRLERSLLACGIRRYLLHRTGDLGDWTAATAHKAEFLLSMRRLYRGPLLYLDADAYVHSRPTLPLADSDIDVALCRHGHEWLTGTIWLNDTTPAHRLIEDWVNVNRTARADVNGGGGQRNLAPLIDGGPPKTVSKLPPELCWIFDTFAQAYPDRTPVIEHLQASREFHWYRQHPLEASRLRRANRIAELAALMA